MYGIHPYCREWNITFDVLFHSGSVALGAGYLVPQTFSLSLLSLRALITLGYALLVVWSVSTICEKSLFLWNVLIVAANGFYLLRLLIKHFPVFIPAHQRELYRKVFEPLQVSRKEFRALMKDSSVSTCRRGKPFILENETPVEENRLRIVLSGKLTVRCDDTFLHFVQPFEFVDSVEWRTGELLAEAAAEAEAAAATTTSSGGGGAPRRTSGQRTYQVSVDVVNDARFLNLSPSALEKALNGSSGDSHNNNNNLNFVLRCLLSKDITRKLYMISDNVYTASFASHSHSHSHHSHHFHKHHHKGRARTASAGGGVGGMAGGTGPTSPPPPHSTGFHRTNSTDAIHTGCKGWVRSQPWRQQATLKEEKQEAHYPSSPGDPSSSGASAGAAAHPVMILNLSLDVPPPMDYLPHNVPVHTLDKEVLAEAQFLAQQRKYWPSGVI